MSSSKYKNYWVSTISDNPIEIFQNLSVFEKYGFGGVHFDVMDGIFVPRLGLYPELLSKIREHTKLKIEVHTMLSQPLKYIQRFKECGANRIIFHVETPQNIMDLILEAQSQDMEVGLAVNPSTAICDIEPYLHILDSVMLMAINPGIPKHPFLDSTLDKLKDLKKSILELGVDLEIQIDGGITFENHKRLIEQGANSLVCGSGTLFSPLGSLRENIARLSN
jgi:ribulose-phosphate 3-epimerase